VKVTRRFTVKGKSAYEGIPFAKRHSEIRNPNGSLVFEARDIDVPAHWSQVAVDILAQKYFRKAGVPSEVRPVPEEGVPQWLWRSEAAPGAALGGETQARQVFGRLAGCWTWHGWKQGVFGGDEESAQAFHDELLHCLATQKAAPNSPQWFNAGLHWAYGIAGNAAGYWHGDYATGAVVESPDSYSRPSAHACFIQGLADNLVNPGGIMDLWTREARVFKMGAGSGANYSDLRAKGEALAGGGKSSGLMSFLKVGDASAGSIKSGGTTRRAARMVVLDLDHPEIEEFVDWKVGEERKVAALAAGSRLLKERLAAIHAAARSGTDPEANPALAAACAQALAAGVDRNSMERVVRLAGQGLDLVQESFDLDWQDEAYQTVSGQNANNSVRVSDAFMRAVDADGEWALLDRTEKVRAAAEGRAPKPRRLVKARALWDRIVRAAWESADPGLQFDDTIQAWHTAAADGRIRASNPCVTGETMVATDGGWRRIDSLLHSRSAVRGADGGFHDIAPAFSTGVKPVYRLTTKAGFTLDLTSDHRVWTVNRGDVPASELTQKDVLRLDAPGFGTQTLEPAVAEFLGLMLGDGCLTGEQETAIVTLDPKALAVADRVAAGINEYKQRHAADGRGAREISVTQPQTTLRIGTSARCVVELLKRYAVLDKGSAGKQFSEESFKLDEASLAAVLRGLFTADGSVANHGDKSQHVSLDSCSIKLVEQVQLLLLAFGVKAKLYRNRRPSGEVSALLPDGKGGVAEYPVQQMHSLRITRSSRVRFQEKVGFLPGSDKQAALVDLNAKVSAYADLMEDRVASLELVGEQEVFDLAEPATNHFVAGGVVVHNCSEYLFLDETACVAGESRVSTASGLRTIAELYASQERGERVLVTTDLHSEHDHRRLSAQRPAVVTKVGVRKVFKIVLKDGRMVRATADHRFLSEGQWRRVDGLRPGVDRLEQARLHGAEDPRPATVVSVEFDGEDEVYDITEPVTNTFVVEGVVTHNCNLASVNLVKFEDRSELGFDLTAYRHVVRLWTVVLDVTAGMAQYPTKETAERSLQYRTLGLGSANLGALLMRRGLAYDSDRGRAWAAALAAIMHLGGHAASAELATACGPFPRWEACKRDFRRVLEQADCAAAGVRPTTASAGLTQVLGRGLLPEALVAEVDHARRAARDAPDGYRNAQVTCIAPTGTIGLLMDCDTTGVEPDFALVKFKKLAGGGYFKIVNQSVPAALRRLGYAEDQVQDIVRYAAGAGTLAGDPLLDPAMLAAKGVPAAVVADLEQALPTAFALEYAMTEEVQALFSPEELRDAGLRLLGRMTVEGAPHLRPEHLAVFDCANPCGALGTRSIHWRGHVDMLGATAPFLAGAASKSANMPRDASLEDVAAAYRRAWEQGVKAIALYRDGSKLSQPLSTSTGGLAGWLARLVADQAPAAAAASEGTAPPAQVRRPLSFRRGGYTQKARVAGHSVYLHTGQYPDGSLGEIFLDMHREGAAFRSLMNSFAIAVSLGLQHGVPLSEFVDAFVFSRFEPNGAVEGHDRVKLCTSVVDYVFRDLAIAYLGRHDLAHVEAPAEPEERGTQPAPREQPSRRADEAAQARLKGYEGDPCGSCGAFTLVRSGVCLKCVSCGGTSGCS